MQDLFLVLIFAMMFASLRIGFVLAISSEVSAVVTKKRGVGGFTGDNYGCNDAALLDLEDSWHYTWAAGASQHGKCNGKTISAEFVPMINGVNQAKSKMSNYIKTSWEALNVRFLLGYNEPDYGNGHSHPHMASPADAAADWPDVQKLAAMFDPPLELVGPAVASGGESGTRDAWDENGHSTWMDEFFGNCTHVVEDCDPSLIKYIAMHDYWGNVSALDQKLSGAAKQYGGRKIWLTEFAITNWRDPPQRAAQDAYMTNVLPFLDSNDLVFRYAWFSTRNVPNGQNGGSNLLAADGSDTLTSTGKIYKKQEHIVQI